MKRLAQDRPAHEWSSQDLGLVLSLVRLGTYLVGRLISL